MKATIETIREIVKVLTADEQQLLKDTIKHGYWGDASAAFVDEELGDIITIGRNLHHQRRQERRPFQRSASISDVPVDLQENVLCL